MRWPPFEHVFFDCDSTLSAVEGIDALAQKLGQGERVRALTDAAMDGEIELREVYDRRLRLIGATRTDIAALRAEYKRRAIPDAAALIAALHALGHKVYIISGGLLEPVREFGIYLGVPAERIRAVRLDYDELCGEWWRESDAARPERYLAHESGGLTESDGKADIVRELLATTRGRSLLVGDGVSDLLARRAVDLFVGFGGVSRRARVWAQAPVFLSGARLAPILPIAAGPAALARAQALGHGELCEAALRSIEAGALAFSDRRLEAKFHEALRAGASTAAREGSAP